MNIYIPYTYLIGWSKHNKFYYGRRTAKNCHPDEFWVKYFTSSKHVKQFRKEHGEPDIIQIRKIFPNNPTACKIWESKFLKRVNAEHNETFLNAKNGDHKWDMTGMVAVRDIDGNIIRVPIDDPRYISGELNHVAKGVVAWNKGKTNIYSEETRNKMSGATKNKKGYKHSEETKKKISDGNKGKKVSDETKLKLSIIAKNRNPTRTGAVLSEETKLKISKSLLGKPAPNKGKPMKMEQRNKLSEICKNRPKKLCPHCERMFDNLNFSRYHGDKCKQNNHSHSKTSNLG